MKKEDQCGGGGVDNCVFDRQKERELKGGVANSVYMMLVLISHTDRKAGRDTMT